MNIIVSDCCSMSYSVPLCKLVGDQIGTSTWAVGDIGGTPVGDQIGTKPWSVSDIYGTLVTSVEQNLL